MTLEKLTNQIIRTWENSDKTSVINFIKMVIPYSFNEGFKQGENSAIKVVQKYNFKK